VVQDMDTTGQLDAWRLIKLIATVHGAVIHFVHFTVATPFYQTWQTLICVFNTQALVTTGKFFITGDFLAFNTIFFVANDFIGCNFHITEFT
jgi:hypothetical protein